MLRLMKDYVLVASEGACGRFKLVLAQRKNPFVKQSKVWR